MLISKNYHQLIILVFVSLRILLSNRVIAENIIFPTDAGIVNVVTQYGADNTGQTDATAAIQQAFNEHPSGNTIFYFPNGVYLVSNTIRWADAPDGTQKQKRNILQGQARDKTIIRLKDRCSGFQDPFDRKAVLWTGVAPAQRFRNGIRNVTVNTGSGNPGAVGIQFNASNQGTLADVTIISEDGNSLYGLDMAYTNEIGPLLIRNLRVIGFDVGIKAASSINSMTLNNITVEDQNINGIDCGAQVFSIDGLTSVNRVTAVKSSGMLTILNGNLTGGSPDQPAIETSGVMYGRNISTSGYAKAIRNTGGHGQDVDRADVDEFISDQVKKLFPAPSRALKLPIEQPPTVPWDDLSDWTNPMNYEAAGNGNADDTRAIQQAIDSGGKTLYFPGGKQFKIDGTLYIRGGVRHILGCEGNLSGNGSLIFDDGDEPVVVFERIDAVYSGLKLIHSSTRGLVLNAVIGFTISSTGSGNFYLDDVCCGVIKFNNPAQHIWMRQFNPENNDEPNIQNNGATLWLLGLKTERGQIKIDTQLGGSTELLGAHIYSTNSILKPVLFNIDAASASFACVREMNFGTPSFQTYIRETRNGETRNFTQRANQSRAFALYTGFEPTLPPRSPGELKATVISPFQIELNWLDNADNEAGFLIERKAKENAFAVIGKLEFDVTRYIDTTVAPATTYLYRVCAYNNVDTSAYSNEVTVVTPALPPVPAAPSDLNATATGNRIELTWKDQADNEDGFQIERKVSDGAFEALISTQPDQNSYTDSGLLFQTRYTYRLRAFNWGGSSAYSNEANALTGDSLTIFFFDMDHTNRITAPGYISVGNIDYVDSVGYGYLEKKNFTTRDRGLSGDLYRDHHEATEMTFAVNLLKGRYYVVLRLGDQRFTKDNIDIYAEDKLIRDNISTPGGEVKVEAFKVVVSDGQLNLRLKNDGGTSMTGAWNSLDILIDSLFVSIKDQRQEPGIPTRFAIFQNYPNPFNSKTRIQFDLPQTTDVSMSIYDTLGRLIRLLGQARYPAGTHGIIWDGKNSNASDAPSGLYFYRIETKACRMTKKMLLLR